MVGIFILSALIVIAMITIINTLTFPRLEEALPPRTPFISLLVPARDEADIIQATIKRLLAQNYPAYEVILLDDNSSDGTSELARQAARNDTRLRLVSGKPVPDSWAGKNWACHQLSEQAKGEVLIFTDADVLWEPAALSAVAACMAHYQGDMFTVWPTQHTVSWAERLVLPLMMFSILSYLPEIAVRRTRWTSLAAANGQCLVFRHPAYQQIGGHMAVKREIVEDIILARHTKLAGFRLVMCLGNDLIHGRMYRNWRQVREGFSKNILAGHGGQPVYLAISTLFHWLLFITPLFWLVAGFLRPQTTGWPWVPLAALSLGIGARALSAAATHHTVPEAVLMPVSVLLMTVIAAQSLWWHYTQGGPRWKGRVIPTSKDSQGKRA